MTVRLGPGVAFVQIGISGFNVTIDHMERRRVVERAAEREQWAPRMDIQFEKHVEETVREKKLCAS